MYDYSNTLILIQRFGLSRRPARFPRDRTGNTTEVFALPRFFFRTRLQLDNRRGMEVSSEIQSNSMSSSKVSRFQRAEA